MTVRSFPLIVTSTPAGTAIGYLPMRDSPQLILREEVRSATAEAVLDIDTLAWPFRKKPWWRASFAEGAGALVI